jgi:hypothetical protein
MEKFHRATKTKFLTLHKFSCCITTKICKLGVEIKSLNNYSIYKRRHNSETKYLTILNLFKNNAIKHTMQNREKMKLIFSALFSTRFDLIHG